MVCIIGRREWRVEMHWYALFIGSKGGLRFVTMHLLSIQGRVVVGMHHLLQQREVAIGWYASFIAENGEL